MKVLIVDDEIEITEIVEFLLRNKLDTITDVFTAYSGNSAVEILKKEIIDICICDHNMPDGNGSVVHRTIVELNLATKFIMCSTNTPKDYPELYQVEKVFFNIQKPDIMDGINLLATKLDEVKENFSDILNDREVIEKDYIPVSLHFLEVLGKTPSDLYIRVSDSKYLKCLNENETYTKDDHHKYINKSITKLYVKKPGNQNIIVDVLSATVKNIMSLKTRPLDEKMSIAHTQLTDLIKFSGMSAELSEVTKENIQQTTQMIMKNNDIGSMWKKLNLMGEYPAKLYTLHSMLATTIVKKLQWSSEATIFKLTLAAFLQDITLDSITLMEIVDHKHFLEIESTLSSKDKKNYYAHPQNSKDILLTFKEIPPDIDKILLEQHEMPDGSGFPRQMNANQLGPLSCVFILSGILARVVLTEKSNFKIENFITKYESEGYAKGNFKEAFNIIKSM